jgi:hypothetical protein
MVLRETLPVRGYVRVALNDNRQTDRQPDWEAEQPDWKAEQPDWKAEQPDWKAEQTVNEQPAEAVTMQRNTPPMPEAPPEQPFATLPAELGEE